MNDYTRLSVDTFLDRLADRTPTPGGGAVAAAAGALATAMGRMVLAYSVGNKTPDDVRARVESGAEKLRRADGLLRRFIAEDATAYQHMVSIGKSDAVAYQAAVVSAASVPLAIAATASDVLAVLEGLASDASRYLLSDLGVAAVVADAAARAAAYSVRVNLPEVTDPTAREKFAAEAGRVLEHCAARRAAIERAVRDRSTA